MEALALLGPVVRIHSFVSGAEFQNSWLVLLKLLGIIALFHMILKETELTDSHRLAYT
jgi:hypothetical protein